MLGDLGGVTEISLVLIGFLFNPISQFSYILKVLEKLYLVRTEDESLIKKSTMQKKNGSSKFQTKNVQVPAKYQNTVLEKEIQNHYPIKLDKCIYTQLFCLS